MLRLQSKYLQSLKKTTPRRCFSDSQQSLTQRWYGILKKEVKKVIQGCKLLYHDAKYLSKKKYRATFHGGSFTLKDHKAMSRTSSDLLKMFPFSIFIIIPGAEVLLPPALYVFPNMVPTTFLSKTKQEKFFKEMQEKRPIHADKLHRFLLEKSKTVEDEKYSEFLKAIRARPQKITRGLVLENHDLFMHTFNFGSMDADQLRSVCRLLSMEPWTGFRTFNKLVMVPIHKLLGYAGVSFPRMWDPKLFPLSELQRNIVMLQLRSLMKQIRSEDNMLLRENIPNMETELLHACCRERAIDTEFQTDKQVRSELQDWVKRSTHPLPEGRVKDEALVFSQIFQYLEDAIGIEQEEEKPEEETIKTIFEESIDRILHYEKKQVLELLEKMEESEISEMKEEERKKIMEKLEEVLDEKLFFEEQERIETQISRLQETLTEQQKVEGPKKPGDK